MKIAAIVPAFNEEKTIGAVLEVLACSGIFSEIIAVDDGSSDNTSEVAKKYATRIIRQTNQGKGAALASGARSTDAEVLFFSDADLIGFHKTHIRAIIEPVLQGAAVMSVGLRDRGMFLTWCMEHIFPLIGGERAIRRNVFMKVLDSGVRDFGIELAMNDYCNKHGMRIKKVRMKGVGQVVKEKKYGIVHGFVRRVCMVWQVVRAAARLRFKKS